MFHEGMVRGGTFVDGTVDIWDILYKNIGPPAFTSSVQLPVTQLVDITMHDKRTCGLLSWIN